jgi:purine-nucleoside/S-methyl-5'-thioadenosine phosphorylase / adenosine deaminase
VKATKPSHRKPVVSDVASVDALIRVAGLVRSGRTGQFARSRAERGERVSPDELKRPLSPRTVADNGVQLFQVADWNQTPWLWHGFSTRLGGLSSVYGSDGELNLGFTATDDRALVTQNRRLLAQAITGQIDTPLVTLKQCHSKVVIAASAAQEIPAKGDGLMTATPGLLLAVQTADCIPVLLADRRRRVVAAFHAGWRGTVNRIVESGVGKMRLEFDSRPQDLIAAIGPGIGACCYAVGEEVLTAFESQFVYARELFHEVYDSDAVRTKYPMLFLTQRAPGHSPIGPSLHLDLIEANRRQLLDAGVKPKAIRLVGGCTNCTSGLFFSYRASQGHTGRMMSVIGVRPM